jgi:stage III sporulation protein AB
MKVLGAAMMTLAGLLMGQMARRSLRRRVDRRQSLCRMLELLGFELGRFQRPLPGLFQGLGLRLTGQTGQLCILVGEALSRGVPFPEAWALLLAPLEPEEREILAPLGQVLGCYGAEELLDSVAQCREDMARALSQARRDLQERGKIYMGLSTVGGLMLAILLM